MDRDHLFLQFLMMIPSYRSYLTAYRYSLVYCVCILADVMYRHVYLLGTNLLKSMLTSLNHSVSFMLKMKT